MKREHTTTDGFTLRVTTKELFNDYIKACNTARADGNARWLKELSDMGLCRGKRYPEYRVGFEKVASIAARWSHEAESPAQLS